MKYLILLTLCFNTFAAQRICLPESEIDKALNLESDAGKVLCKDKPLEQCICKDVKGSWRWLRKEPIMVDGDPIYSKSETESCVDQSDCESILGNKTCVDQEESLLINEGYTEVYCSKFTGYNQIDSGLKKLALDEAKKSADLQAELDAIQAEKNEKNAIKAIKSAINSDNTISNDVKKVLRFLLKNI